MSWPEGASTIRFLLGRGKLDAVDRASASAAAHGNLERAGRRLTTARAAREHGDVDGAYVLAYDAYRMAAEALLAQQGLRATGGEGGHVTVEDAASGQFAVEAAVFAKPTFERFRRTRHTAQYFDPQQPDITDDDAVWALERADQAVTAASRLLSSRRLGPFEP